MVEGISELRDGVLLGERYRLVRRLEDFSAGTERVAGVEYEYWVARDETSGAEVWIEFAGAGGVYAEGAALAGSVAALRRINHPAVPAVHAFGEYEFERDGVLRSVGYCAISALEGETLAAAMVRETLDRAEILLALGQVAEVLQLLGEFELVHGHLSAHSVLLTATADAGYEVVLVDLPASLALETTVESELTWAADVYALAWLTVLVLVGPAVLEAEFGAGFAATLEYEIAAARVMERRRAWAAENLEVLGVSAGLAELLLLALGESANRPRVTMLATAIRAAWVEIQQRAMAPESVGGAEQGLAAAAVPAEAVEAVEAVEVVESIAALEAVEAEAQAGAAGAGVGAVGLVGAEGVSGAGRKGSAKKSSSKKRAVETAAVVGAAGAVGLVAAESASAAAGSAGSATALVAESVSGGAAGTAGAATAAVGETVAVEETVAVQESAGAVTEVIPVIGGGRRARGGSAGRPGSPSGAGAGGSGAGGSGVVGASGAGTSSAGSTGGVIGTGGAAGSGASGVIGAGGSSGASGVVGARRGGGTTGAIGASGGAAVGGAVGAQFPSGPVGGGASGGGAGRSGGSSGGTAAHRRRPRRAMYAGIGAGVVVIIVLAIVFSHGSGGNNSHAALTSTTPTATTANSATSATAGSPTAGSSAAGGASPSAAVSPSPSSAAASASAGNSATTSAGESGSGSTSPAETVTFPATLETYPASPGQAVQEIQQATQRAQGELSQTEQGQLTQIINTLQQEIGSKQSTSTGTAQLWALLHSGELPTSFNTYVEELASYLSASGGS